MYPRLALEEAIGLVSLDLHRHRLDSCFITVLPVGDGGLVALLIAPPSIHTSEHRGPVLALRTSCACVDLEDSTEVIFFCTKHILELYLFEEEDSPAVGFVNLFFGDDLFLVVFEGKGYFFDEAFRLIVVSDPLAQVFDLEHLSFGACTIFPEGWICCA